MLLITDTYKRLNKELHETRKSFGAKGYQKSTVVYEDFIKKYNIVTALDYACGKASLSKDLELKYGIKIHNYDPCIDEYSTHPTGLVFDGVICNDALEHIEPELLDNVLQDIYKLGTKAFHFEIGLTKSNKTLSDGRNNHLIVEPSSWWKKRLEDNGYKIVEALSDFIMQGKLIGYYRVICIKNDNV